MWTLREVYEVVRDLVLLITGVFGIVYQQVKGVNVPLLVIFTAMTGAPGGLGLLRLVARTADTPPSPPPPSPPPSGVSGQ